MNEDSSSISQAREPASVHTQSASTAAAVTDTEAAGGDSTSQVLDNALTAKNTKRPIAFMSDVSSSSSSPEGLSHTTTTEYETKPGQHFDNAFPSHTEQLRPAHWHPSVLRMAPLAGLASLLLAVLLLFVSYAVLAASDGDEVAKWDLEANVYLAILTGKSARHDRTSGANLTLHSYL